MTVDIVFSHQGLATTTLVHATVTMLTGFAILAARRTSSERWIPTLVALHTVLAILTFVYLLATYFLAPL
jgi:hypothetical protein